MVSDEIRKRLADLCLSRRTRTHVFSVEAPCDWRPSAVTDPRTREAFTEDGAWDFVSNLLRSGHTVEAINLDRPAGKIGYVLKYTSECRSISIYIKLQMMGDCVKGRSFHP